MTQIEPGALLSRQNNIWINICTPRNIPIASLKEPEQMKPPRHSVDLEIENFLGQFGSKLGEIYHISNIQEYPENIVRH
jgi:hypothetical protein